MARSTEWESVPMAVGDPRPAWPLPSVTPKFATWSFGGGRPFGCEGQKCERWHVRKTVDRERPDRPIVNT